MLSITLEALSGMFQHWLGYSAVKNRYLGLEKVLFNWVPGDNYADPCFFALKKVVEKLV